MLRVNGRVVRHVSHQARTACNWHVPACACSCIWQLKLLTSDVGFRKGAISIISSVQLRLHAADIWTS